MIFYSANHLKSGLKVLLDKQPCYIENVEFVKPGKGQSFARVKLKNLITGQLIVKTFRSTDVLCHADILDIKLIYLYYHKNNWYFMNSTNFEQTVLDKNVIQSKDKWLIEQESYLITFWDQRPILISINNFVNLTVKSNVAETTVGTVMSSSRSKLCKLCTGIVVSVPLFIQVGDIIKIDTRTGEYHSRINK